MYFLTQSVEDIAQTDGGEKRKTVISNIDTNPHCCISFQERDLFSPTGIEHLTPADIFLLEILYSIFQ